jgi:hypothetical protein
MIDRRLALSADARVAGHRELQAAAQRGPLDRRDGRLGAALEQRGDRRGDARPLVERAAEVGRAEEVDVKASAELACAKGALRARRVTL